MFDSGNNTIILVNIPSNELSETYGSLLKLTQDIAVLERIPIFAGGVYHGLNMAYISYHEALDAADGVVAYSSDKAQIGYHFTPLQVEMLSKHIASANEEGALELYSDICIRNYNNRTVSFPFIRCLFFDIAGTAIVSAQHNKDANGKLKNQLETLLTRLYNAQDFGQMQQITQSILENAIQYNKSVKSDTAALMNRIILCVERNYANPDFNVTYLAESIAMNMSYISKYFKEKIGIGLYDYISLMRVSRAKELLKDSNVQIKEIAHQVGFENDNSFIRVFKKHEGITPGGYRKQLAQV
ncbi:hypothetical protein AGMMS49992_29230 [Clostridia bacterium]|nr:hypothetical protein AGMMS49992_29230 [Clostridia bacterium]